MQALSPGPDRLIKRQTIEADLRERLDVDQDRAVQLLAVVGATITQAVSTGQIEDVQGQLPEGMRGILSSSLRETAEVVGSCSN